MTRSSSRRLAVWLLLLGVAISACGVQIRESETTTVSVPDLDPGGAMMRAADRAMIVTASTCGDAGGNTGSGVAITDGRVLTAAHVIAGADEVELSVLAEWIDEEQPATVTATVIAYDTLRDLAILEFDPDGWSLPRPPLYDVMAEDQAGVIIGGSTSGDIDFTITDKTIIEMDEVRGDRRSQRSGYLLAAETAPGDSGAGLYDASGRLTGLLFAGSTKDETRSWATAADEIQEFLEDESVIGTFRCNPKRSRIERAE